MIPSHVTLAYIDPGTGSALVYVVLALLVSAYFALRGLYYRVLELVLRSGFRYKRCELAVHSEHPRYETTFLPILRALSARGLRVTYFPMYERSELFEPLPSGVEYQPIAEGMVGYARLNHIEAKLLVTTTPQLDVMTFRRSKRVKHYAIINHALGESRYVKPYAYDFFDTVMCCGPIVEANIRKMEGLRGFARKQLLHTGLPHYDELARNVATTPSEKSAGGRPIVLIAPSWGALSMFQRFGTSFIPALAARYHVIVRPHPQMKYSQQTLYEQILALHGVEVDTSQTPAEAMLRADVLVSDFSGIIHEFAFIHEKPVVLVDPPDDFGGLEGAVIGGSSELREACREFIVTASAEHLDDLTDHVATALAAGMKDRIVAARTELIFNYGRAGEVAAGQLAEILKGL
jgi:hypothetical protein